jgi:hypothetical protein
MPAHKCFDDDGWSGNTLISLLNFPCDRSLSIVDHLFIKKLFNLVSSKINMMGLKQPTCILRKGLLSQQNLHQRTFIHDEKMTKKNFQCSKCPIRIGRFFFQCETNGNFLLPPFPVSCSKRQTETDGTLHCKRKTKTNRQTEKRNRQG